MPASSLFAEMERPTPTSSTLGTSATTMDEQRALQIALELSLLGLNNDTVPPNENDPFAVPGLTDDRCSKRSQNMTECVPVPSSEHVAEIVGRQGCKIRALRAKTNTYIKTPVRGEDPIFVVTGRKEDVSVAKREILSAAEHFSQIRACRKNNLNGSMAPGPPTNVPGQVTIQVRVPYRVVGLVVGPKGATIKRIQQQTHTYIVTPSRDKEPVFEVTGMPESVEQARKEIEAHIAMRTGGLLDQEDPSSAAVVAAAAAAAAAAANGRHDFTGTHSLDNLFSSSADLVSSLCKLNNGSIPAMNTNMNNLSTLPSSMNNLSNSFGVSGLNSLNSLNGISGLNSTLGNLNSSTLNSINNLGSLNGDLNSFGLLGDSNSLLGNSKTSGLDNALFSSLSGGGSGSKLDVAGGLSSLYSVDEGLGSLGSSMGSSPSFDPSPSSIWSDLGRSFAPAGLPTTVCSSTSSSTLSSLSSSLTRRSSSVSGASPPSSRLSPSLEAPLSHPHPPARRISSDPNTGLPLSLPPSSTSSSANTTPELATSMAPVGSGAPCAAGPGALLSSTCSSSSTSSSPSFEKRCVKCSDATVEAAMLPCGHNHFCMDCAQRIVAENGPCPICGGICSQAIRIFS